MCPPKNSQQLISSNFKADLGILELILDQNWSWKVSRFKLMSTRLKPINTGTISTDTIRSKPIRGSAYRLIPKDWPEVFLCQKTFCRARCHFLNSKTRPNVYWPREIVVNRPESTFHRRTYKIYVTMYLLTVWLAQIPTATTWNSRPTGPTLYWF